MGLSGAELAAKYGLPDEIIRALLTTIPEVLEKRAQDNPDKVYLYFEDQRVTYRELNQRANQVAHALLGLGVKKGDKVACLTFNSPEMLYAWLGILKAGGVFVPVNVALRGDGLSYILNHCDAEVLIIEYLLLENLNFVRERLENIRTVIVNTADFPGADLPQGMLSLPELMAKSSPERPDIDIHPLDYARMIYTSGTTGRPKGVISRHALPREGSPFPWAYSQTDILYTCLPLFHANALMVCNGGAILANASVALARRFSASRFWDDTRKYNATVTFFLGAMPAILMKQPEKPNDADNPIQWAVSAAVPKDIWVDLEKRFGLKLQEFYGAVDGGGFLFNPESKPGSMGRVPDLYEARIVDENGNDCPPMVPGELWLRSNDPARRIILTPEYYKDPEETQLRIGEDGWVKSGDFAYRDEEGWYYFVDRKKDAIRKSGENISSWEVERVIEAHPEVLEAAAFGVPSEMGEDEVKVNVVLQPGAKLTAEELIAWCELRMAYFMVPRYLEFVDGLPKTETHRVEKYKLKQLGVTPATWDRVQAGYQLKKF